MDFSRKMNSRRTFTYCQLGSVAVVRAPHTVGGPPWNWRMALMPAMLIWPWSASFIASSRPTAPLTIALAGALYTPRVLSVLAMIPQTCPDGGTRIGAPGPTGDTCSQG